MAPWCLNERINAMITWEAFRDYEKEGEEECIDISRFFTFAFSIELCAMKGV